MREFDLYEPIREWLHTYMFDKYKNWEVFTVDAHSERLDRVLRRHDIFLDIATGVDIQIDILGFARKKNSLKIIFVEVKNTRLTLKDLGQLWSYCKLIDPDEAFLISSANIGSLNKLLNIYKREDLLDFGDGKIIKKMKICTWNSHRKSPQIETMIPKI